MNIPPNEASKKINDGAIAIDVRTPKEFAEGHIAGAVTADIYNQNFADKIGALDKSKDYLVYCQSGGRSAMAQKIMLGLGFQNVFNLSGGISSWAKEGMGVVKD